MCAAQTVEQGGDQRIGDVEHVQGTFGCPFAGEGDAIRTAVIHHQAKEVAPARAGAATAADRLVDAVGFAISADLLQFPGRIRRGTPPDIVALQAGEAQLHAVSDGGKNRAQRRVRLLTDGLEKRDAGQRRGRLREKTAGDKQRKSHESGENNAPFHFTASGLTSMISPLVVPSTSSPSIHAGRAPIFAFSSSDPRIFPVAASAMRSSPSSVP